MRESRTYGSVRAKAKWLSYSTIITAPAKVRREAPLTLPAETRRATPNVPVALPPTPMEQVDAESTSCMQQLRIKIFGMCHLEWITSRMSRPVGQSRQS
jgi:hypothetical protein